MNKVIIMGRLVRDPDIRYSQGEKQTCVAKYTVAVDRRFNRDGGQNADFINCTAFGKPAEFIEKYCHKGTKLIVEGRWTTGSYTNKDGQKIYTNELTVEQQEFAESKKASEDNSQATPAAQSQTMAADEFMQIPDGIDNSELPFN